MWACKNEKKRFKTLVKKRQFFVMTLLLILIEPVWAGTYELVMSKDKELCESMLGLYNKDMATYGRINYDAHEIFSQIKWENIDKLGDPLVRSYLRADFDINNDGKIETVIKFSGHVLAVDVDELSIYPGDEDIYVNPPPDKGGMGKLKDTPNLLFSGDNNIYYLRDLPEKLQEKILAYKLKHLPKYLKNVNTKDIRRDLGKSYIAGSFVLQPFIWHGTSYISMTNRNPEWFVVGKYKQAEELQDICYFYDHSHRFISY